MTPFQTILLSVFSVFAVAGVILFAGFTGQQGALVEEINVWGSVEKNLMEEFLVSLRDIDKSYDQVKYTEIDPTEFDQKLTEALATGNGPDIFMFTEESILKHKAKIYPIPYEVISERDFKDKYIEEAEILLTSEGILGVPFFVDPMVMYWNRDIFSSAGVSSPPKKWEEFYSLSQKITETDQDLNVLISFISFGEFRNLNHAKDIVATLMMQADSKMTSLNEKGELEIELGKTFDGKNETVQEAINFFVQFSNPSKSVYTWNRSMPRSDNAFVGNDLALYIGYASEINDIRAKNPNLNFDVTYMPQASNGRTVTFGKLTSLALSKNSRKIESAFGVLSTMSSDGLLAEISRIVELPPVARTLLSDKPTSPYATVFYDSALFSKAWLDPEPASTDIVFQSMIENIVSGRDRVSNAISRASAEMKQLK